MIVKPSVTYRIVYLSLVTKAPLLLPLLAGGRLHHLSPPVDPYRPIRAFCWTEGLAAKSLPAAWEAPRVTKLARYAQHVQRLGLPTFSRMFFICPGL